MRIYVSATYRDLARHRQAVSTVLRRMGHQVIGMEEYVAEGTRPLNRCLMDVAGCDAYVGILAWRYGYVPTSAGVDDFALPAGTALGETSITEFEFRRAVDDQKENSRKTVLMFLLDPEAEWPSSQFDAITGEGDGGRAITKLRQDVAEDYLVGMFRSPEDLAALVSAAVYRAEMSRQMSLESLSIDARFNQPFIRNGPVADSTLMEIKNVIAAQPIQALRIDLGEGFEWWMTRLYFLCSLASDLTSIEAVVFVEAGGAFVGVTNPEIVKERLARQHPMIARYESALARTKSLPSDLAAEVDRRAALWGTEVAKAGGEHINPIFVSRASLARWLGPYLISEAIDWTSDGNAPLQMQRMLDWPMRFVPVVEHGRFVRIVDKRALTEQVARLFVREQVSRALSTFR
jgi:Domain of unknown function (DUF4062)